MKVFTSSVFDKKLKKLVSKNPKLEFSVCKQLELLKENINYPSLRLHKLKGRRSDSFSIWIEANIRVVFGFKNGSIVLEDIVTHDQY